MVFNVALSGITAAGEELGVVGNNIANSNTVGFKSSRAEFSDVYAASALGTASNTAGSGVRLSDIKQSFSQGTVKFTSNNLDLAINGAGFFQLNDGGSQSFTRAGSFIVDRQGYIVNASNQRLVGFLADSSGNITGVTGDLQINSTNLAPTATTSITNTVNINSTDAVPGAAWVGSPAFGNPPPSPTTYNNVTSTTIYDSLGNAHVVSLYYVKTATPNEWNLYAQVDGVDVDSSPASAPFLQAFNSDGSYNAAGSDSITISWPPLDASGNPTGASTPQVFTVDVSASTQFGSPFAVNTFLQNGFTTGGLDSVDVDPSGLLFGRYTNGQTRAMGQVFLQSFTNTNGLQPLGDTNWGETFSSGPPLTGIPGSANLGAIQGGALEESNVKLTAELVQLILAQRNFQANAQTIRTADTVTQTIINLR